MKSSQVKACVASYFRYKRQAPIVSFERPLDNYYSNPDIFIVTKKRMLVEVEVKVNIYDLKNDIKKKAWMYRNKLPDLYPMPFQFYYAVPDVLKDKAKEVIDNWKAENKIYGNVGLIVVNEPKNSLYKQWNSGLVWVMLKSPANKEAKKLSIKQIIKMVRNQTGTLCSYASKIAEMEK